MLDYSNTNDDLVMVHHKCQQLSLRAPGMLKTALLVHHSHQDNTIETSSGGVEVVLVDAKFTVINKRQEKRPVKRFTKDPARSASGKMRKVTNKTQNTKQARNRTMDELGTDIDQRIKSKEPEAGILEPLGKQGAKERGERKEANKELKTVDTELSTHQRQDIMYVSHCMKALFQYCDDFSTHDSDWMKFLRNARKGYSSLSMAFDYPYDDDSSQLAKLYELFHLHSDHISEGENLNHDLKILRNIHKGYLQSRHQ